MRSLFAVLIPIAMVNSLSTLPPMMAGIIAALGTRKPYLTAIAFITGKFLPYFLFGLLIAFGLDSVFDHLKTTALSAWQNPGVVFVIIQLLIGLAMLVLVFRLTQTNDKPATPSPAVDMPPIKVFSFVAGATVLGLPGAIFYFAAIDQILRADPYPLEIVYAILLYNFVYLFPLILVVVVRRLFGVHADPLFDALSRFFDRWGKTMLAVGVSVLGIVLVADAVSWFAGIPLLPLQIR